MHAHTCTHVHTHIITHTHHTHTVHAQSTQENTFQLHLPNEANTQESWQLFPTSFSLLCTGIHYEKTSIPCLRQLRSQLSFIIKGCSWIQGRAGSSQGGQGSNRQAPSCGYRHPCLDEAVQGNTSREDLRKMLAIMYLRCICFLSREYKLPQATWVKAMFSFLLETEAWNQSYWA